MLRNNTSIGGYIGGILLEIVKIAGAVAAAPGLPPGALIFSIHPDQISAAALIPGSAPTWPSLGGGHEISREKIVISARPVCAASLY